MLRILFIAIAAGLIVALGFLIDAQSKSPAPPPPRPSATEMIFAPGRLEGRTEEIQLRPQIRGQIIGLPVVEGQILTAGAVLLELDAQQYEYEIALASAELALAKGEQQRLENGARQEERDEAAALHQAKVAELAQVEAGWKRALKLRASEAISQQEEDDLKFRVKALEAQVEAAKIRADLLNAAAREDEVEIARAKVDAAQSRLHLAKVTRERATLKAFGPARVMKVNVELGELTGPEANEPAIILADTTQYRVRAFVEELDAPRVQAGMKATIVADGLPDLELTGHVTHLSPRMSAKQIWTDDPTERYDTKTREIWINLDAGSDLVVGLRVDVMIDPSSAPVPASR